MSKHSSRASGFWSALAQHFSTDSRQKDEALDEERRRARRGTTPIRDVHNRQHVTLFGTLMSMTYPPEGSHFMLVGTLYDGTASIELRWPGRMSIPGLKVGEHIEVEGTAGMQGDVLTIINPLYRIIASESM